MAEKRGFEPLRDLHLLIVFETTPFDHLGTSPKRVYYITMLIIFYNVLILTYKLSNLNFLIIINHMVYGSFFSNINNIILLAIISGALIVVILFVVFCIYQRKSLEHYYKRIKQESNTIRIFAINVKENHVDYFNRSDLRNKRTMDLSSFYSRFSGEDSEKVKKWILSICVDPKNADQYLEADVIVDRGKSTYFSLLKLVKFDPQVGVLHLESHILKYITPSSFAGTKKKKTISGVIKRSVMKTLITKSKSLRGFTFAIRFFYIRQKALSNEKIERYMMMTLKNEVYPFALHSKKPRQMIDELNNEILLFDLHLETRDEAMRLAASISHSLKKCIGVNGYSDSITFAIGVVENAQYYQDFDQMVQKAEEACINAQQNSQDIFIYQKSHGPIYQELNRYSEEIDKLINSNNMRYLFRPIVDVSKGRLLGYFEYVKAYSSPFNNFSEMSKYAAKVGKNRELFASVAKAVIPKFASERPSEWHRLFFTVSLLDVDHMATILPQIPQSKDIRLVLVFDEQEVNENASQLELLNNSLKKFRTLGYEIALQLQDKNLLLDPSVYTNFDYFVAGAAMMNEIKKNNRVRLSIHTLIEQLLKFRKPIIATDLEGWQAVELIIKSGITMVSSEVISASNDMFLPIDKKKNEKLLAMYKNFK